MRSDLLIKKYGDLPPEAKQELIDFIDSLMARYSKKEVAPKKGFSFNWEGSLSEIKSTSVELQHLANQWR